jgi:Pyruvate/2-oxoacid:ferredoxin oxidoreductase delta subunit
MNVLLFSSDPIALDATVCRMMHLDPMLVPTIVYGQEASLGTSVESDIEILGDTLDSFIDSTFLVNREPIKSTSPSKARAWVRNSLVSKPVIDGAKCVKCGVCVQVCPVKPKAVDWHDDPGHTKPPTYQYKQCIRCFCCQELCPESAIYVKSPWFRKVISTILNNKKFSFLFV